MLLNVCFDLHATTIECDNIDNIQFSKILKTFENWLYGIGNDGIGPCLMVKKSLNIEILDINVVIRFFNEMYKGSNPRIINNNLDINDIDKNIPVLSL